MTTSWEADVIRVADQILQARKKCPSLGATAEAVIVAMDTLDHAAAVGSVLLDHFGGDPRISVHPFGTDLGRRVARYPAIRR